MDYFVFDGFSRYERERFNEFIDSQPAAFRKQETFKFGNGQAFGFHIHQPAKDAFYADEEGDIYMVRKKGQPNLRVRLSPQWQGDTQRWRYLKLDTPYRFEMEFTLNSRADKFKEVNWANLFELWGPFDGKDTGRNPAFEIMLRGADQQQWDVRQRGDKRKQHDKSYERVWTNTKPFEGGTIRYKFVVETKLSINAKGYTRVWINDEKVMDLVDVTNTYNSTPYGDEEQLGGMVNFPEIYTPNASVENYHLSMFLHSMKVSDGVEEKEEQDPFEPTPEPEPITTLPVHIEARLNNLEQRMNSVETKLEDVKEVLED